LWTSGDHGAEAGQAYYAVQLGAQSLFRDHDFRYPGEVVYAGEERMIKIKVWWERDTKRSLKKQLELVTEELINAAIVFDSQHPPNTGFTDVEWPLHRWTYEY
jgi:hypothetical protein